MTFIMVTRFWKEKLPNYDQIVYYYIHTCTTATPAARRRKAEKTWLTVDECWVCDKDGSQGDLLFIDLMIKVCQVTHNNAAVHFPLINLQPILRQIQLRRAGYLVLLS